MLGAAKQPVSMIAALPYVLLPASVFDSKWNKPLHSNNSGHLLLLVNLQCGLNLCHSQLETVRGHKSPISTPICIIIILQQHLYGRQRRERCVKLDGTGVQVVPSAVRPCPSAPALCGCIICYAMEVLLPALSATVLWLVQNASASAATLESMLARQLCCSARCKLHSQQTHCFNGRRSACTPPASQTPAGHPPPCRSAASAQHPRRGPTGWHSCKQHSRAQHCQLQACTNAGQHNTRVRDSPAAVAPSPCLCQS